MPNNAEVIRESLKRCMPWLGRMVAVCSYENEDGSPVALPEIDGAVEALRRAEVVVDDGNKTELLAMLKQCVPWMKRVVDGGYHEGCGMPNDAVDALAQARRIAR